jgi:hypothetical protein
MALAHFGLVADGGTGGARFYARTGVFRSTTAALSAFSKLA